MQLSLKCRHKHRLRRLGRGGGHKTGEGAWGRGEFAFEDGRFDVMRMVSRQGGRWTIALAVLMKCMEPRAQWGTHGASVGTERGFRHPDMQMLFASGDVH